MLCYFVRHGEAEQNPALHDSERGLTTRGFHQATTAGKFLKKLHSQPELIVSSTLHRAQQTAQEIALHLHVPIEPTDYLLNGIDHNQFIQFLNTKEHSCVVLVGHQPLLSEIISLLITNSTQGAIEIKPCTIAAVEIPKPIMPGKGKLTFLILQIILEQFIG